MMAVGRRALVGLLILLGCYNANAQTPPAPSPSPTPKPKVAFVRFWNMLPDPKKDTLDLYLDNNQLLTRASASSNSSAYIPVLPNTYTLFTQRALVAGSAPVKTPAVRMLDGSFFTILATLQNGQVALEVLDDAIDPKTDDGTVRLVVRQYYPGARAVVTAGSASPITLNYGETSTLDHLPTGALSITIQTTVPGTAPKTMSLSANYTAHHRGTLLIVGDLYGRFRPFLTVDGFSDLNLSKVMERWLQTSQTNPILMPATDAGSNVDAVPPAASKKSHAKAKTKTKRRHRSHQGDHDSNDHPKSDRNKPAIASVGGGSSPTFFSSARTTFGWT